MTQATLTGADNDGHGSPTLWFDFEGETFGLSGSVFVDSDGATLDFPDEHVPTRLQREVLDLVCEPE